MRTIIQQSFIISVHLMHLMGNAVATQSNAVNLPDSVVTTVRGNLIPGSDSSYDIGSNGVRFSKTFMVILYMVMVQT